MLTRRLMETLAMVIIGDSLLSVVRPRRHMALWWSGPSWWERAMRPVVRHPGMTRLMGLGGLGLGFWLAFRQQPYMLDIGDRRPIFDDRFKAALE